MNYANASKRPSPAAMLGAFGVPAGIGAILVAGLAVTAVITVPKPNPTGVFVTPKPIDPPPPAPEPSPQASTAQKSQSQQTQPVTLTAPETPFDFQTAGPIADLGPIGDDLIGDIGPIGLGIEGPVVTAPLPDPIAASPRGNPGKWVTTRDYRSSWIRRGYSGRASFTLQISASGKVSDCTITRSTGYSALDEATCKFIAKRAEFTPAKDSAGSAIAGSYSSAINWELPE